MDTKLEWGGLQEGRPSLWSVIPAIQAGKRLFVVQNGEVVFPSKDVMIRPFDGITSIGWINVVPIQCRVEITSGLSSRDEIPFYCTVDLEINLRSDQAAKRAAAERGESLYSTLSLCIRNSASETFRAFDYASLLFGEPDVLSALHAASSRDVLEDTPYKLLRCSFDVAAAQPGLDEQLALARGKVLQARQTVEAQAVDLQMARQRRELEGAELDHQLSLSRRRGKADRQEVEESKKQELKLLKLQKKQETEFLKELDKIFKDDKDGFLAYKYPALYTKIRTLDAQDRIEVARVLQGLQIEMGVGTGRWEGMNETIRRLRLVMSNASIDLDSGRDSLGEAPEEPSDIP